MKFNTKKLTITACLCTLTLTAFAIESLFPPLFLPFSKLGLSNIFVFLALIAFSSSQAYIVMIVKCILGNLLVGNLSSMIYSLSAGIISLTIAILLFNFFGNKISILAISITSAIVHNLIQNLVFCLVTQTPELFIYAPYLTLLGIVSGFVVGLCVEFIFRKLPISFFEKTFNIYSQSVVKFLDNENSKEDLND